MARVASLTIGHTSMVVRAQGHSRSEEPVKTHLQDSGLLLYPQIRMRAFLEQEYTVPPVPKCLNRNTFLPGKIVIPRCMATTDSPNGCLCKGVAILGRKT